MKEFGENIISLSSYPIQQMEVVLTISIEQRMTGVYSFREGYTMKPSERIYFFLHIVVGRECFDLVQLRNLECM